MGTVSKYAKLETIGISPVFYHCLALDTCLPSIPLNNNQQIVGDIKTIPADFQVTEIGRDGEPAVIRDDNEDKSYVSSSFGVVHDDTKACKNVIMDQNYTKNDLKKFFIRHGAKYFQNLRECSAKSEFDDNQKNDAYQSLSDLHDCAINQLNRKSDELDRHHQQLSYEAKTIIIRLDTHRQSNDELNEVDDQKSLRRIFHKNLKAIFPLLKSENVQNDDKCTEFCVKIDDKFDSLIDVLVDPVKSLMELNKFYHLRHERNSAEEVRLILINSVTKEKRRIIHKTIMSACRDFDTSTKKYGSETIVVVKLSKRSGIKRQRNGFKTSSVAYFSCVLKKTNVEYLVSLNLLCRALSCKPSDIGVAGIKDKCAITTQHISIRGVPLNHLLRANEKLSTHGVQIGSFKHISPSEQLTVGCLQGNKFDLVVRKLGIITKNNNSTELSGCPFSFVNTMVKRVKKTGFINFYGEQRLGRPGDQEEVGIRSFDIGRALLQRNYQLAIDLIIAGHDHRDQNNEHFNETEEVRYFRSIWIKSNRNIEATLKAFPKHSGLNRERQLLIGLKRYGLSDPYSALCTLPYTIRSFWINSYQALVWNICASERIKRSGSDVIIGDLYESIDGKIAHVTCNNIKSLSFHQLVLPLPGHNIIYPDNFVKNVYEEILKKDMVKIERSKLSNEFESVKGAYRRIVAPVENMSVHLNSTNESYAESVRISFQLSKGSYATMVLRELFMTTFKT